MAKKKDVPAPPQPEPAPAPKKETHIPDVAPKGGYMYTHEELMKKISNGL